VEEFDEHIEKGFRKRIIDSIKKVFH